MFTPSLSNKATRESPDGKDSSLVEAANICASRNSTAFGIGEISEEEVIKPPTSTTTDDQTLQSNKTLTSSDLIDRQKVEAEPNIDSDQQPPKATKEPSGPETETKDPPRDIVREYVLQEEEKIAKRRSKLPLKFRDLKPVSVAKNRARMNIKKQGETDKQQQQQKRKPIRSRSWSTDKILENKQKAANVHPRNSGSLHNTINYIAAKYQTHGAYFAVVRIRISRIS